MRRALALALAGAALAAAPGARAECPDRYEFVLIADDTGELALSSAEYGGQPARPAIDAGGEVAFTAWLDAVGRAIQLGDEHGLRERLRDRDADPGSAWLQLSDPLPSLDGKVVFGGLLETEAGVSAVGAIAEIAATGRVQVLASADGGRAGSSSEFVSVAWGDFDVASNGEVVFAAQLVDGPSAIVWGSGGATRIAVRAEGGAGLGHPAAGGPGELCYFEHARGEVLRTQSGLVIAETDPATGLGPASPVAMGEGGTVAYVFAYPDPARAGYAAWQIRRYSPVTQTSLVLADSALGHFRAAGETPRVSLVAGEIDTTGESRGIAGCVVFDGHGDEGRDAIFIADEDGVATVLIEGDELLGAQVSELALGSHAVNGRGQIALWARAGDRQMIVRADPLPEAGGSAGAGASRRDAGADEADPPDDPSEPPAGDRSDAGQLGSRERAANEGGAPDASGACAVRRDGGAAFAAAPALLGANALLLARRRLGRRTSRLNATAPGSRVL